jgi:two-component system sensor histidine kinase RegB
MPAPRSINGASRLRLRTHILVRWVAIAGQIVAVLGVHFGLGFSVPLVPCFALISASLGLNILLLSTGQEQRLLRNREAAALLTFDTVQLTALLGLTGGLTNPFVVLLIVPVVMAASHLSIRTAWWMLALVALCAMALERSSLPLPWFTVGGLVLPDLYLFGVWTALLVAAGFMAFFAGRIAVDAERIESALLATQNVLAREQKLAALGGLAAMTAHELGTPLATIRLVAKELQRGLKPDDPIAEDVGLIVEQSARCAEILRTLSSRRDVGDPIQTTIPLYALLEEVSADHKHRGKAIIIQADTDPRGGDLPTVYRSPEILHGLGAMVENAVDFAATTVTITARTSPRAAIIEIRDDGPGFAPDILAKLGEPYITSRPLGEDGRVGLGLGFFIAKTLLERAGARVEFGNQKTGGAFVRTAWRRKRLCV